MSVARSQSRTTSRRQRANTAQSVLRPAPPALPVPIGETITLNAWVHDPKESTSVIFNQAYWLGLNEGDLLRVVSTSKAGEEQGYLFTVPREDNCFIKPQLQISIPQAIANTFDIRNNTEVSVTKVAKDEYSAHYVEFYFQDQYLGRNDMWRLGKNLVGHCIHQGEDVGFIGSTVAKVQNIYINGEKVSAAYMTSTTKAIYRSMSARATIYIQVCRELWQFSGDGERYNEKIVHSFLPALFSRWREAGTNHTVTIVLISRVYYDASEIDYAAGPLRKDDMGRWYKDFFKVITDLEVLQEWKPTLVSLKTSFWDFQRDILLTHHYHRSAGEIGRDEPVRLVGQLSCAHDGPILEALNLGLNPTETHYIDRSLSLTGATFVLITPGTGWFKVSKQLLRLTTTRMLDQGTTMDIVCLAKPPLHLTPIFAFQGPDVDPVITGRADDVLWDGGDSATTNFPKKTFWWEPFFLSISFWDQQMDVPFRQDRFVPRAKMYEIEMLGLLAQDILSSIEVPYLSFPDDVDALGSPNDEVEPGITREQAERFDLQIFSPQQPTASGDRRKGLSSSSRASLPPSSVSSSYTSMSSVTSSVTITPAEKRQSARASVIGLSTPIASIEESPSRVHLELPPEPEHRHPTSPHVVGVAILSPPRSASPAASLRSKAPSMTSNSSDAPSKASSLASKLAPAWLRNPFRSGPSEPQTTTVSASGVSNSPSATPQAHPIKLPSAVKPIVAESPQISPLSVVQASPRFRAVPPRTSDEEVPGIFHSRLASTTSTPPRDDASFGGRRRSGIVSGTPLHTPPSSSPTIRTNPSRLEARKASAPSSFPARRWQHFFSQVSYKKDIKWKSLVTPGCLPLTVEYFPSAAELESSYDFFSYDFVIDPNEMKSFLVRPPPPDPNPDEARRACALVVMRGMAAVRLAQGFQFVLAASSSSTNAKSSEDNKSGTTHSFASSSKADFRRPKSFMVAEDMTPRARGASEILVSTTDPVYLSMTNEIHRISYTGEAVQVGRYVRRRPATLPFEYQCLIWPKLGVGYTELSTKFESHGPEGYGWNRLDMLVAGYEQQFNESLRYWRTRFVVIPTIDPPQVTTGPSGEKLNHEEARILGIEKLAEQFSKLRFTNGDRDLPPVRFLPTTLTPAMSILDDSLMEQLDQIHASGPLRKKVKSEREIFDMPLAAIAKAMHEPDGVPIKHYQWHNAQYHNAFTGFDFVSWLVREFRDVSSRSQGAELGMKLQEQGLFEHCRGYHNLLDGHYFYRLKGEYAVPVTPKNRWFAYRRPTDELTPGKSFNSPRRPRKKLILSQTMVVDIDPARKSDQAESVLLHHDIIHNPATVFHFELQWIGTTARCIEDNLRQWNRVVERYGLNLVEAYVTQISDVQERNAFQSCFPIPLAVPPPTIPDLAQRIPEGMHAAQYFEYALLQKFDFLVDIEAGNLYPEQVDVMYSYRRSSFRYSQFVHRTGLAFVQVLGAENGFLYLTNRLLDTGSGRGMKGTRPNVLAEDVRTRLQSFCSNPGSLKEFYDEQIRYLKPPPAIEDPPDLAI